VPAQAGVDGDGVVVDVLDGDDDDMAACNIVVATAVGIVGSGVVVVLLEVVGAGVLLLLLVTLFDVVSACVVASATLEEAGCKTGNRLAGTTQLATPAPPRATPAVVSPGGHGRQTPALPPHAAYPSTVTCDKPPVLPVLPVKGFGPGEGFRPRHVHVFGL